jgi:glucose/arabinose dehydrogenase
VRSFRLSILSIALLALLVPAGAHAAALVPVAPFEAWGSLPLHAASPPGDARLFVVERGGNVRLVKGGVLQGNSFLTVPNIDSSGERGLLSIAFPPDYATSGLFYVFTVAAGPDALDPSALPGDARIVEYRRSATNPDLADPASARLVLKQEHSANHHYGGQLAFGPDGYLYATMGDGGNPANAQALGNDLGKVLRIDPRDPAGPGSFGVPPSNPFVGGAGSEIYALGLRNPYRASFGPDGELIVGDVGETAWEEVNLGTPTGTPASTTLAGANLGWPNCEGACVPPNGSFVDPVFQYGHGPTPVETTGCAIIGGYVVRDPALTGLTGRYLYGDRCRDDLRTLDLAAPNKDPRPAGLSLPAESGAPLGFGEDGFGCIYVATDSTVFRVAASATAGAACPSAPAGPAATDKRPPVLRLGKARRLPLRRFIPLTATCDEACTVRATGRLAFPGAHASAVGKLIGSSKSGPANRRLRLRLKLSKPAFRRATRARSHGRRVIARIAVTATDASGNAARRSKRIALR